MERGIRVKVLVLASGGVGEDIAVGIRMFSLGLDAHLDIIYLLAS